MAPRKPARARCIRSIPAIANAIFDAIGVRMDALPFSPPRVWKALQDEAARDRWERSHHRATRTIHRSVG